MLTDEFIRLKVWDLIPDSAKEEWNALGETKLVWYKERLKPGLLRVHVALSEQLKDCSSVRDVSGILRAQSDIQETLGMLEVWLYQATLDKELSDDRTT